MLIIRDAKAINMANVTHIDLSIFQKNRELPPKFTIRFYLNYCDADGQEGATLFFFDTENERNHAFDYLLTKIAMGTDMIFMDDDDLAGKTC